MTWGHRGSLLLRCRAFSSLSSCRFIPALSPRSPVTAGRGRRPAMPRQPRHEYAADLPRGLLAGHLNRRPSRPPTLLVERALLPGPDPPDSSRFLSCGGSTPGSCNTCTFPSRLPGPGRLAVPTRPVVVGAAPTLPCASRVRLPPASPGRYDSPEVGLSSHEVAVRHHLVEGAQPGRAGTD